MTCRCFLDLNFGGVVRKLLGHRPRDRCATHSARVSRTIRVASQLTPSRSILVVIQLTPSRSILVVIQLTPSRSILVVIQLTPSRSILVVIQLTPSRSILVVIQLTPSRSILVVIQLPLSDHNTLTGSRCVADLNFGVVSQLWVRNHLTPALPIRPDFQGRSRLRPNWPQVGVFYLWSSLL